MFILHREIRGFFPHPLPFAQHSVLTFPTLDDLICYDFTLRARSAILYVYSDETLSSRFRSLHSAGYPRTWYIPIRVRKPENILKRLTIRGTAVHAGGRIRNRNLPISSSSRYQYRHGWHGVGGIWAASEFSSVENISRWHKLEKGRSGYVYKKNVWI